MESTVNPHEESEPLEFFRLGRRIRRGLATCSELACARSGDDVAYLWIHLGPCNGAESLTQDHWLNIIDEAASVGANWMVVTLGESESRAHVPAACRWACEMHGMVVCLHAPGGLLLDTERTLLDELPADKSFLLVEQEHAGGFRELEQRGIHIGMASPAEAGDESPCNYPHRMIYVDSQGRLYTCGLVSGDAEFFLGSVFSGSLGEIIHNPALPHSVPAAAPNAHQSCSGCPPLVAKHLCNR